MSIVIPSPGDTIINEGGAGLLVPISSTTIVAEDSIGEFGFDLDTSKAYRLIIPDLYITGGTTGFRFEGSEDGGLTFLSNACYSSTHHMTSQTATDTISNIQLAAFANMMLYSGQQIKINVGLTYGLYGWVLEIISGGWRDASLLRSANGHGGIKNDAGVVNFINFFASNDSVVGTIKWYEEKDGF